MGIAIPQVITPSKASGAQVIDGSLKFDSAKKNRMDRTATSGSPQTWTLALWVKKEGNDNHVFGAGAGNTPGRFGFGFNSSDKIFAFVIAANSTVFSITTSAVFRDIGWYHITLVADTSNGTQADRFKVYVNGVLQTVSGTLMPAGQNTFVNSEATHTFGRRSYTDSDHFAGRITNAYLIDGQALGPEYFGFTDPLTNTWKPKKYKVALAETVTVQPTYVSNSSVLDPTNAFDGSSGTEATYSGVNSWLSFTVSDASNLTVPFRIRNDSSGTGQTVAMFTDSGGSSAAGGTWGSTGTNNLSPAVSTTVDDTYTFPSTGTYYLRHTVGSDSNIFVYKIGGDVTTGGNSFYLPMDGNSPIGQDQSGNGNDFTPVNFGGSLELDNPNVSGARPILNTTQGGSQAAPGVFGSKQNVGYAVTVYNDGGGNKYYIDGVKTASITGLIRGATYTFDTSDSTVSTHPFRFSATSNGSHGGGSEYTNGVAAITGAATTITVPHDAPNTLYYYCTSHSGMGNDSSISGITTNEKLADQYASNIVFASPLVGVNADVCASIACTASTKSVTSNGNAAASSDQSNFYSGSFEFDGTGDYITVTDNAELEPGTGDFCYEAWFYSSTLASSTFLLFDSTQGTGVYFYTTSGSLYLYLGSSQVASDYACLANNKWTHIAFVRESGTGKIFCDGVLVGSGSKSDSVAGGNLVIGASTGGGNAFNGYIQDVRVYNGVAKYTSNFVVPSRSPDILPDTPSGVSGGSKLTKITDGAVSFDGNATETSTGLTVTTNIDWSSDFTVEGFYYPNELGGGRTIFDCWNGNSSGTGFYIWTNSSGDIDLVKNASTYYSQGWCGAGSISSNKWSHFAIVRSSNTLYMYIDGVNKSGSGYSISDSWSSSRGCILGSGSGNSSMKAVNGFMNNVRISQTAVYTSNFTPPTTSLSSLGADTKVLGLKSQQSVTSTEVGTITDVGGTAAINFNPFNTDINTVRGQETGYPTWNPLVTTTSTLSNNNLTITTNSGVSGYPIDLVSAFTPAGRGQWYWEFTLSALSGSNYTLVGMMPSDTPYKQGGSFHFAEAEVQGFYVYIGHNGTVLAYSGAATAGSATGTIGVGDVLGWAYDAENGTLKCFINGVPQGTQFTNIRTDVGWLFGVTDYDNSAAGTYDINFGQKPFKFPPPDGYQTLNTANTRPVKVISRPDQYVGVATHTGDGGTKSVSIEFKPDLVWSKSRSGTNSHKLYDSVRGVNEALYSNAQTAQTDDGSFGVRSFDYNGFTVKDNSDGDYGVNGSPGGTYSGSAGTYVAWCWKAGGNKNTFNVDDVGYATAAAAGLDGGSITPTGASVGTKQGFSIIQFTNTTSDSTQSHGLTQKPDFIIWKKTSGTSHWPIYHSGIGATKYMYLNLTNAAATGSEFWSNTEPTNSLVTTKGEPNSMGSAGDTIMYLWHDVPGLQKFGSYTGNGDTGDNGPFIELGFRPAIIWFKRTEDAGYNWNCYDTTRSNTGNPTNEVIRLNLSNIEEANYGNGDIDVLANGFKIRNYWGNVNANNKDYIYCAWAEAPSIDLYGGGANAR